MLMRNAGCWRLIAMSSAGLCVCASGLADQLIATPAADSSIYSEGDYSNSKGSNLFAGTTNGGAVRRALMKFDLSAIPAGSTITSVSLRVTVNKAPPGSGSRTCTLHRCNAAWAEGSSNAGLGGGPGAIAEPGDPTWLHRAYSTSFWATQGGDFVPAASASAVLPTSGQATWASTPALVADVQAWVDAPATNQGWICKGDEATTVNTRRFYARETGTAANRPTLTVMYTLPTPCTGDIANDAGVPLPTGGPNSGINEGDYNAFFQGFFNAAAYCDLADDAGRVLPSPFPNTGVNEGDYNLFFQVFFNDCP